MIQSGIGLETTDVSGMKNELVNIASHEMKTSIQSILTYSELLHSMSDRQNGEYVEAIHRNALRLQKLSMNLLDVTKIENQTLVLKNEKFAINELILHIIQDIIAQKQKCGIKIEKKRFSFDIKEAVFVWADKDRIAQVISNLIDNAFKFTQKGNVTVKLEQLENSVVVAVRDCGPGINPHMFPRLFSKFFTSSHNGVGLGLYISMSIVKAHDGRIWARNNADVGATFSFEIPSRIGAESSFHASYAVNF